MSRPHLLYIAFWYPPSRASGVYRAVATASAFNDSGWRVTVVTSTHEYLAADVGSVDPTLEETVPAAVNAIRVPFNPQVDQQLDIRTLSWFQASFPAVHRRLMHRKDGAPDRYSSWIEPAYKAAKAANSRSTLDHILATGNPYSSFEVARRVSEATNTPFSVDYRDPWTIDVFTGEDTRDRSASVLEGAIVEAAHACFHVNEPIRDAYREKYPLQSFKQHVASNGFDPDSLGEPAILREGQSLLRFGIIGTVTERWPLRPLFEGWRRARNSLPSGSTLTLAGHMGFFERNDEVVRSQVPIGKDGVAYVGPVPKRDLASFYSKLNVVVVPVAGGALVTSGKIFEALAQGVPVVCIQESGGGARALLKDHPVAFGADPDPASVESALLAAASEAATITSNDAMVNRGLMNRYERMKALRSMVRTVSEAVTDSVDREPR